MQEILRGYLARPAVQVEDFAHTFQRNSISALVIYGPKVALLDGSRRETAGHRSA